MKQPFHLWFVFFSRSSTYKLFFRELSIFYDNLTRYLGIDGACYFTTIQLCWQIVVNSDKEARVETDSEFMQFLFSSYSLKLEECLIAVYSISLSKYLLICSVSCLRSSYSNQRLIENSLRKYLMFISLLMPTQSGSNQNLKLERMRYSTTSMSCTLRPLIISQSISRSHFSSLKGAYSQQSSMKSSPSRTLSTLMRFSWRAALSRYIISWIILYCVSSEQCRVFLTIGRASPMYLEANSPKGYSSCMSTIYSWIISIKIWITNYVIARIKQPGLSKKQRGERY